jgi:hypothetical protein
MDDGRGLSTQRAARHALGRRKLPCPDCSQLLRPWGRARERTIRELAGALAAVRPDRARCTGCGVTHVVLGAGLLPAGRTPPS